MSRPRDASPESALDRTTLMNLLFGARARAASGAAAFDAVHAAGLALQPDEMVRLARPQPSSLSDRTGQRCMRAR